MPRSGTEGTGSRAPEYRSWAPERKEEPGHRAHRTSGPPGPEADRPKGDRAEHISTSKTDTASKPVGSNRGRGASGGRTRWRLDPTAGDFRRPGRSRPGNRSSDLRERNREPIKSWYTLKGTSPICALRTRLGSRHAVTAWAALCPKFGALDKEFNGNSLYSGIDQSS
jgi:hypothetical protein